MRKQFTTIKQHYNNNKAQAVMLIVFGMRISNINLTYQSTLFLHRLQYTFAAK